MWDVSTGLEINKTETSRKNEDWGTSICFDLLIAINVKISAVARRSAQNDTGEVANIHPHKMKIRSDHHFRYGKMHIGQQVTNVG